MRTTSAEDPVHVPEGAGGTHGTTVVTLVKIAGAVVTEERTMVLVMVAELVAYCVSVAGP
jgi:hypothetical protein